MRITNAQVFDLEKGFVNRDIYMEGNQFTEEDASGKVVDAGGCYAIPGLIDLHLHGCMGQDFTTADQQGLEVISKYQAENGVTSLCPTTLTLPEEKLAEACRRVAAFTPDGGADFAGIHLEGPFVSIKKIGAQNPDYLQNPNTALYYHMQEASGGLVKILALAPELEGAMEAIQQISGEVTCSIAHSTASYEVAKQAFAKGARQVTHLYNAMPPFSHREPGIIGAAMETPECMVELICDGVHIHPTVVEATFRMFGHERIIFISDSMMATGLKDGRYDLGGLPVIVEGNISKLADSGSIAGSVTNLMGCLRTAVQKMGIPLHHGVQAATVNPAKAIGVFKERGSIEVGKLADLVLLEQDLTIRKVYVKGQEIGRYT